MQHGAIQSNRRSLFWMTIFFKTYPNRSESSQRRILCLVELLLSLPAKPFRDPTVRSPALVGPPDATLSSEIATRDGLHASEPRFRRFADRHVSPSSHGSGTRARASSLRRGGGGCTDAQQQETRARNLISWGWECKRAPLVLYLQQLPSLHCCNQS